MPFYYCTSDTDDQYALIFEAKDHATATSVILSLAGGHIGLLEADGAFVMPTLVTRSAVASWLRETFGVSALDELMRTVKREDMASALDTFFAGNLAEYVAKSREWAGLQADIRERVRKAWDDRRSGVNSSLSLCQTAWAIAKAFREDITASTTPPAEEAGDQQASSQ